MRIWDLLNSAPFISAFWVFVGIVAGALIQHWLNGLTAKRSAANALQVVKVEAEINLDEMKQFLGHIARLKEKISAGQAKPDELFFPMANFDYSALAPLVNSGYFHAMLGRELSRAYLAFMRFFNNQNSLQLAEMLKAEQERGTSLDLLHYIERRSNELGSAYSKILKAELPKFGSQLVVRVSRGS